MAEPPEFDIYPDLDRQIEAAVAAQTAGNPKATENDLGELVLQEIGAAEEEPAEGESENKDKKPSEAKTLDELRHILEFINQKVVMGYIQVKNGYTNVISKNSRDAKALISGKDDLATLNTAENQARAGKFDHAKKTIELLASDAAADSMRAVIDTYVFEEAQTLAKNRKLEDAFNLVNDWASAPNRGYMKQSLIIHVLDRAADLAKKGNFDEAKTIIDSFTDADSSANEALYAALDTYVLAQAEDYAPGMPSVARKIIKDYATAGAVDRMLRMLGV